jgi:hypothetical protein
MLVACCEQSSGGFAVALSTDLGVTWSETLLLNIASNNALGVANGRLFATVSDKLLGSAGIGI